MLSATIYYQVLTRDYAKTLAGAAADKAVARESSYYLANIGKVKTIDEFLKNQRLYAYAMQAFGLGDQLNAKGMVRKVLEGGVSSPQALANTLRDSRFKALASALDFAAEGPAATSAPSAAQSVVDRYVEQKLEANVARQSEGARMALYFQRMAPGVSSAYGILGDKTLLNVVQTAFGLPASMSQQNIDMQAKLIAARLKIGDLQDPAKVHKFIQRFTAAYDAKHPSNVSATPTSALDVASPGISGDLLLSLAKLKLGGS